MSNNSRKDKLGLNSKLFSPLFSTVEKKIQVEIKGAIKRPGKYRLEQGTKYFDLIEIAGGFSSTADRSRVTKNYYLKDGQLFRVPYKRFRNKAKKKFNRTGWIEVEMRGFIKRPGVYKIKVGTRFFQLLRKAGGFNSKADRKKRYKNYLLKDGQSFYIR